MDREDVVFAEVINRQGERERLSMDIYTKPGQQGKRKAILFLHGGGFIQGNDRRQNYVPMFAERLVEEGYCLISPDYCLYRDDAERDADGDHANCARKAAREVRLAYDFLTEHSSRWNLDLNAIAIGGGSAGAMASAYMVADNPGIFRAYLNCWGTPFAIPDVSNFPKTLLIHGMLDRLISFSRCQAFMDELKAHNVPYELIQVEGEGHTPVKQIDMYFPRVISFLQ